MDARIFWPASFFRGVDGGSADAAGGFLSAPCVCQAKQMGGADVNPLLVMARVCYVLNCRFYDAQLKSKGVKIQTPRDTRGVL